MSLPFTSPLGVNYSNSFQSKPISGTTAAKDIVHDHIANVKLFHYDQLGSFAKATSVKLIPGIPNSDLANLSSNDAATLTKITKALTPYKSQIVAIMVGNEPLLNDAATYGPLLASALTNLNTALTTAGFSVPLSVPFNSGIESTSWPPSQGAFNSDYTTYLTDVCTFLSSTHSFFTINIYPFYAYDSVQNPNVIPLPYALFTQTTAQFTDPNTNLEYYNLFDAMYDATVAALANLNFAGLPLVVGESGWPTANGTGGDATVANAKTYNQNLINHVKSGNGTPANPSAVLQTFLFELYDEDQKPTPPNFEPNWGIYEIAKDNTYKPKYKLDW